MCPAERQKGNECLRLRIHTARHLEKQSPNDSCAQVENTGTPGLSSGLASCELMEAYRPRCQVLFAVVAVIAFDFSKQDFSVQPWLSWD